MIDERLLPSESEAQIDENFNRVLALVDNNANHIVTFPQGPASEVFSTMPFLDVLQLANAIEANNAHAIMEVDASGASLGRYTLPVMAYADQNEVVFSVPMAAQSNDLAVQVLWNISVDVGAFRAYMLHSDLSEWADVSTIFGLFPATLTIYYHPMD